MATKTSTSGASEHLSATFDTSSRICLPPPSSGRAALRRKSVRRQVTPISGRALEILGHAIEYLADEYVLGAAEKGTLEADDPRIDAMHILMSLNREVYYACPEVEPALSRIARWLARPRAPRAAKGAWN